MNHSEIIQNGASVLAKEGEALLRVSKELSGEFLTACDKILDCSGKVVVSGIGKAGHIGKKISATLASTGTPSVWLDPINALHGDLGMIQPGDIALLLSNSGSSGETLLTAQALKSNGVYQIAMTSSSDTPLSSICDITLPLGVHEEACSLKLAPSTSTTVMLAMGDAVALTVQRMKGFEEKDYAKFHPAGALGRRLMNITALMRTGDKVARILKDATIIEAIQAITSARSGICVIVDDCNILNGVYTDGDFRRDILDGKDVVKERAAAEIKKTCSFISSDSQVQDAIELMASKHINALPVVSSDMKVLGVVDIQDII
jgi:KpsF/GutQ family protein